MHIKNRSDIRETLRDVDGTWQWVDRPMCRQRPTLVIGNPRQTLVDNIFDCAVRRILCQLSLSDKKATSPLRQCSATAAGKAVADPPPVETACGACGDVSSGTILC